jgi:hypothetical protein
LCAQALLKWMHSYKASGDHMVYISSSVYWTTAYVLAHLEASEGAAAGHSGAGAQSAAGHSGAGAQSAAGLLSYLAALQSPNIRVHVHYVVDAAEVLADLAGRESARGSSVLHAVHCMLRVACAHGEACWSYAG